MDNTAELPVRMQLYWSSAEGRSRGIPAALVADMYCTNVMAYTLLHSWIEATFFTQGRLLDLTIADIMKLAKPNAAPMAGEYMDTTGTASWYVERATPPVQVSTPAAMSEYGKNDMGYA